MNLPIAFATACAEVPRSLAVAALVFAMCTGCSKPDANTLSCGDLQQWCAPPHPPCDSWESLQGCGFSRGSSLCGGFEVAQWRVDGGLVEEEFFEPDSGALHAEVIWFDDGPDCVGGPWPDNAFELPDCSGVSFVPLPCPDAGSGTGACPAGPTGGSDAGGPRTGDGGTLLTGDLAFPNAFAAATFTNYLPDGGFDTSDMQLFLTDGNAVCGGATASTSYILAGHGASALQAGTYALPTYAQESGAEDAGADPCAPEFAVYSLAPGGGPIGPRLHYVSSGGTVTFSRLDQIEVAGSFSTEMVDMSDGGEYGTLGGSFDSACSEYNPE